MELIVVKYRLPGFATLVESYSTGAQLAVFIYFVLYRLEIFIFCKLKIIHCFQTRCLTLGLLVLLIQILIAWLDGF